MASGSPLRARSRHRLSDVGHAAWLEDAADRGAVERRMGVVDPERACGPCEPDCSRGVHGAEAGPHPVQQAIPENTGIGYRYQR